MHLTSCQLITLFAFYINYQHVWFHITLCSSLWQNLHANFQHGAISNSENWQYPCSAESVASSLPFCNTSLSFESRAKDLIYNQLNISELISIIGDNAQSIPRYNISKYEWWSTALHGIGDGPGITYTGIINATTMFPEPIGTSSSFNRTLWNKIGIVTSTEARAMWNNNQAGLTYYSPTVDIFIDPRWGRGQETTGEDPFVIAQYGVEFVKGMQGNDDKYIKASTSCKHYGVYTLESYNGVTRHEFDALVSNYDLNDTYNVPFKYCVTEGKTTSLMCAYNSVNGVPACANKYFLTDLAKNEWGLNGYISSDCNAVYDVLNGHSYANDNGETISSTLKSGMDMECGDFIQTNGLGVINSNSHELAIKDIQNALYHGALIQFRLGLFDPPNQVPWVCYFILYKL